MVKKRKVNIKDNLQQSKYPPENCCIACLSEDAMLEVKTQQTVKIYEELIQVKISVGENQNLILFCLKCKQLLDTFKEFKETCLISKNILDDYRAQLENVNEISQIVVVPDIKEEFIFHDELVQEDVKYLSDSDLKQNLEQINIKLEEKQEKKISKPKPRRVTKRRSKNFIDQSIRDVCKRSREEGSFECNFCHKKYHQKYKMQNHIIKIHYESYSCNKCDRAFLKHKEFLAHLKDHDLRHEALTDVNNKNEDLKKLKIHKCNYCEKAFISHNILRTHMKIHKPRQYAECDSCGKRYERKPSLLNHMMRKHFKCYPCKHCSRAYFTEDEFLAHMNDHATGKMKIRNSVEASYVCTVCGDRVRNLNQHMDVRHPIKTDAPSVCELCGKSFETEFKLKRHVYKNHQPKIYSCDKCDYKAGLPHQITQHCNLKHNPEKNYVNCNICGRRVIRRGLANHRRLHLNQRSFECTICGAGFNTDTLLKKHAYVHSSVKRWNCHLCSYAISHLEYLQTHYIKTHGYPPGTRAAEVKRLCIVKEPVFDLQN